jgi:hypothetical protein
MAAPDVPAAAARQVPPDEDEGELDALAAVCAVVNVVSAVFSASCAVVTLAFASVSSMRASTSPTVTWSPGRTRTSVTVPLMLKARPRDCAGCSVPAAATAEVTVPRCTRAVTGAALVCWAPLVS